MNKLKLSGFEDELNEDDDSVINYPKWPSCSKNDPATSLPGSNS